MRPGSFLSVEPDPELEARAESERAELGEVKIRPFVMELANRGGVKPEEYAVRMNSYERNLLVPHFETELFVQVVEYCLQNCERRDEVSYDGALQHRYMPEALRRIQAQTDQLQALEGFRRTISGQADELTDKLLRLRRELRSMVKTLTTVLDWSDRDGLEGDKRGLFSANTFADGVKHAKAHVKKTILGRLGLTAERPDVKGASDGTST